MPPPLRRALLGILVSGFCLASGSACAATKATATKAASDPVVAKSDGVSLHASEVQALLDQLDPATRARVQADPQALAKLVSEEMTRRLVLHEASARHWESTPSVQALITRARDQVVETTWLQSAVKLPADYPSDEEIRKAWELNQAQLMQPRQYHIAQIYLAVPAGALPDSAASTAVRSKLEALARPLRGKPDQFADVARASSEDKPSAANGGDLGWLPETRLEPAIREKVAQMAKGEVSAPLFASGGWHLLRMLETRPAAVLPLDQARPQLVAALRKQKLEQLQAEYLQKLLGSSHATLDRAALQGLVIPSASAAVTTSAP